MQIPEEITITFVVGLIIIATATGYLTNQPVGWLVFGGGLMVGVVADLLFRLLSGK